MPIVLLIINIVIIVILVLVGLIALLLLAPVKYEVNAAYKLKNSPKALARLSYLFGVVTAGFKFKGGKPVYYVKIFGKTLIGSGRKKKRKKKVPPSMEKENVPADKIQESSSKKEKADRAKSEKKVSKSKFGKLKKIKNILTEWTDATHRRLIGFLWKNVIKILKIIKPKVFSLDLAVGTGDEYTTGNIIAWCSVFYGLFGLDGVNIKPDFENKVFDGRLYIRGKFIPAPLAFIAIKVLMNKDFRKIILKK